MLRLLDELLFALRRNGLVIAPSQAIDCARAVVEIGVHDRELLRETLAWVVVGSRNDRPRFDAAFDDFFAESDPHVRDFWGRLRREGFTDAELSTLKRALEALAQGSPEGLQALVGGPSDFAHLLATAEIRRSLEPLTSPLQAGFYTQRLVEKLGLSRPSLGTWVDRLHESLRDAFGAERASALMQAIERELERARASVRLHVEQTIQQRLDADRERPEHPAAIPFAELDEDDAHMVRQALRQLADKLRGQARVRERRARRGRLEPHRTLRKSLRTFGVPLHVARRDRRRDKPRLVVLCDLSDSVRQASRFFLELVCAVQELFEHSRSFVFVGEVGEVTRHFQREQPSVALAQLLSGSIVDTREASSYGRAFRTFETRFSDAVDGRTTLVVLGDGRTNHRPHGADALARIASRAKRLLWLCPEPRARWGVGDSAMPLYASIASQTFEARCAADLESIARELVRRA